MTYQEFINLAEKKGINNIQITEETKIENSIYFINKNIYDYTNNENISFIIKAEKNGKTEQVATEYLEKEIIDLLLEKLESTETNYQNEYLKEKENIIINETINVDISNDIKEIKQVINEFNKKRNIKSLEIAYGETYTKTRIINNAKVDIATSSHNYELYVEANIEEKSNISTYSEKIIVNNKNELNFKNIIEKVIETASCGLKRKQLENKKYNIILSNEVTSQIMKTFAIMLSGANINQKISCLEHKKNKQIFSEKITIVEEPTNKTMPGYTRFDKEGTTTYDKYLVENGIIRNYLYDIKEAKIAKTKSTGNKYNGIETKNMYILPGKNELEELFKKLGNGIYITNYMGASGTCINSNSGNISIQIFGYIIENGKIICAFEPSIMTTTIFELFSNVKYIGDDLKFTSQAVGAPSLYIENISIAAK